MHTCGEGRKEGSLGGRQRDRASPFNRHTHTHTHTLTSLQPSWCDCPALLPGRQTSTNRVASNKGWARSKAALLPLLPLVQLSLLLSCIEEEKEAKAAEGGAILSLHSDVPMTRVGVGAGAGATDGVCACRVVSEGHERTWRENAEGGGGEVGRSLGDGEQLSNGRAAPPRTIEAPACCVLHACLWMQ